MKTSLISIVKLVIVVGLIAYVFTTIQWQDQLSLESPGGEAREPFPGKINGRWDLAEISFDITGQDGVAEKRLVRTGRQADGSHISVTPGVFTYLRNLNPIYFIIGSLCYLLTVLFAATRWWWLLKANSLSVSLHAAHRYNFIGLFSNNFIPGQTGGDLVKALYVMKHCPDSRFAAVLSVVVDRVMGLTALALLGAVTVLFFLERFQLLAAAIWSLIAGGLLFGTLFFSRRIRRKLKLDRLLDRLPNKLQSFFRQLDQAVLLYRSKGKGVLIWLLLSIGNHILAVFSIALFGESLQVGLPTVEYFVLVPVITIVSAIPIAPNGWGIGEALFGQLFADYGAVHVAGSPDPEQIMRTRGVLLSVLFRLHATFVSLIGGAFLLFEKDRVTRKDMESGAASSQSEDRM